jgi:hypothetical protein
LEIAFMFRTLMAALTGLISLAPCPSLLTQPVAVAIDPAESMTVIDDPAPYPRERYLSRNTGLNRAARRRANRGSVINVYTTSWKKRERIARRIATLKANNALEEAKRASEPQKPRLTSLASEIGRFLRVPVPPAMGKTSFRSHRGVA